MKIFLSFALLFFMLSKYSFCQHPFYTYALQNTFMVKIADKTGTCFMVKYYGKFYFITARHLFDNPSSKQVVNFDLNLNQSWLNVHGNLLLHKNPYVDIAVISGVDVGIRKYALELSENADFSIQFGDQGFFFGFPYMLATQDISNINNGFPLALLKRATFSGRAEEKKVNYFVLDGINNPGFSGGPVLFQDADKKKDSTWHVIGVVHGYFKQTDTISTPSGILQYSQNSGIFFATDGKYIREILNTETLQK